MQFEAGERIVASYMGNVFTGTVVRHRGHTINWAVYMTTVTVDKPFELFGRTVEDVIIHHKIDGSPLNGEHGRWGDETDFIQKLSF